MNHTIAILGRQPYLGLAELESLYGATNIQPLNGAALIKLEPQSIEFNRLGGVLKLAQHIATVSTTDWALLMKYMASILPERVVTLPPGKIRFGMSVYGLPTKPATLNRSGLEIKKLIKRNGRSVRIVPNTLPALSTAQTIHNQLAGSTGMEFIFVRHGKQTLIGQVIKVQDIGAYADRDQKRPMRDARVGMLPPKLAQIIINLATGNGNNTAGSEHITILDPFCGTGVILQESLLMGYNAHGTDLELRMTQYTQENLQWLTEKYQIDDTSYKIETADATSYNWTMSKQTIVACETYLGRPFNSEPDHEVLNRVMQDVETIHRKFLQNLYDQIKPGTKICLAVPAWQTRTGFKHLKLLDSLSNLGYTRQSFVHAKTDQLVYFRPNQIVARELVVIQRTS
ncbi:MAG: TRM11 family methyltransferase [Candidatus Saccharimonadales bacterium]